MLVDVKRMIDTALIKPATRCQLGHGGADELGIAEHRVSPMTGRKNALELNTHTLTRHGIEQRRTFGQSLFGRGFNHKVQAAGKAHRAQHAQGVLIKTALGIADSTNQLALQITLAVVAVDKPAFGMPGHSVDGKVAARQIVLERGGTLHTLGMATIGVKAIQAVRGDLDTLAIGNSVIPPNLMPDSTTAMPAASSAALDSCHRPLQHISTSWLGRPIRASRTQPPTYQASRPAASSARRTRRDASDGCVPLSETLHMPMASCTCERNSMVLKKSNKKRESAHTQSRRQFDKTRQRTPHTFSAQKTPALVIQSGCSATMYRCG